MKALHIDVAVLTGADAQDKDKARTMRVEHILPALERRQPIVLDFSGVDGSTQSFVHACISEAFRRHGDAAADLFEFKGCVPAIRNLIRTVVEYSTASAELLVARRPPKLTSQDIPQADSLERVRAVIDALGRGDNTHRQIVERTQFSRRHVEYRLHAARVLGFIKMTERVLALSEKGKRLLTTVPGSEAEREAFEVAIEESELLRRFAPDLLDDVGPTDADLAKRIVRRTTLGPVTAMRRARALLRWRKRVRVPQLDLFGRNEGEEEDVDEEEKEDAPKGRKPRPRAKRARPSAVRRTR